MTKRHGLSLHPTKQLSCAAMTRGAESIGIAILLLTTATALGQTQPAPAEAVQNGYEIHQTADLGGHMVNLTGSGAMYDTLVNIQSGPRVLGETFTMRAAEGTKHSLLDSLTAFSNGFGGDPNNYAKLDFSKGKLYEFSGMFRRDRQYADYDLLGAPDNSGQKIPYGMVAGVPTTAYLAWGQNSDSPVMFNTVRRMTDTNLTILPLSKVTFHVGYSQNIFQGPTISPARSVGKYDSLAVEYQRNSTDDFTGAIDWKPLPQTKITFEEVVDHFKTGSYFTMNPNGFQAQEADGTPVSLGDWDFVAITATATAPYTISACNATGTGASMGSGYTNSTNYTIFTAPQTPGGMPIVNPACDVITSYLRSQPTRTITPTEMLRFQSSSIRNVAMNGDFRFTMADTSLPNYYESWTGLDGAIRSSTLTGNAKAKRQVLGLDYGITWQATKTFALSEQVDYSNAHQPGSVTLAGSTLNTPATAGNETINYSGALTTGNPFSVTGNTIGTAYAYFGQSFLTNNVTGTWDASPRATLALTYRYRTHVIALGFPHNTPSTGSSDTGSASPAGGTVTINENGGILNAALRPTNQWDINGTVEIAYADNVYTPVAPRQTKHYRIHTLYRPKPWATLSGAFNDVEHHNNTNNVVGTPTPDGPLQHVDYSRSVSLGAAVAPNEHYSFDFNYAYTDVYTATNICYLSAASTIFPGAASTTSTGANNLCPNTLTDWGPSKDFMDAPTQSASFGLTYSPNKTVRSGLGYRISAVSGNQFFSDAQQVNGSLQSAYQSPYVNLAWTLHPGLIWRMDYNFYGYGEGGPSGAPFCSTATSTSATVVPCNSSTLTGPTGLTESPAGMSAPRNFHANNVTLSMHYEF